jgi:DNA-binding HxlR family transcriptional regulator
VAPGMENQTTSRAEAEAGGPSHEELRRAFAILSGKWKLELLWHLSQRTRRFGELRKAVPGITQHMLTAQLRELEADGLVSRTVFAEVPTRVEYAITAKTRELEPVIVSLIRWWRKHHRQRSDNPGKTQAG